MWKEPIYKWDAEKQIAFCSIFDTQFQKTFVGIAKCHPDDEDMASEKTGMYIAGLRAIISILKYEKKEIKKEIKTLYKFHYTINRSKQYNKESYENRMLHRNIKRLEEEVELIEEEIKEINKKIINYIEEKEKFYQVIRRKRRTNLINVNK